MIKSSAKRSKKPREPMFISPLHVHFYISRLESDKMILNLFFEKNLLIKNSRSEARNFVEARNSAKRKNRKIREI